MEFPKAERLRIYTGPRPASANDPITTQTVLLECQVAELEFLPAEQGGPKFIIKTVPAQTVAWGSATWFRVFDVDGRPILDGSVGNSVVQPTPDLMFPLVTWHPGMIVHIGET